VTVYLVGAGPGDPGLLTRRGAELLAVADVVVHDRLVDPAVLSLARPGSELIDVGKPRAMEEATRPPAAGSHAARQAEINELLVTLGRSGRTVVRLKGGDPLVFGRGGEEAASLAAAGVGYEIVPGVSAAFAVPASAGVPVTHRGLSASVTVVTGRVGDGEESVEPDWEALARTGGTLVVLMGVATRAHVAARLMAGGLAAGTPVLVGERGTTPEARSARTTLGELGSSELRTPAIIVIGPVAALDLTPPATGPLARWKVVVTRPRARAGPLLSALRTAGASVVQLPVTEVADPSDGGTALRAASERLDTYEWIAFTSATAVDRLVASVDDLRKLHGVRLAVVGGATADALAHHHLRADLVAPSASAASLAEAFPAPAGGGRVLFPAAAEARPDLVAGLCARGWEVDQVEAYRTVRVPAPSPSVLAAAGGSDAITFAAPSAVAAYLALRDGAGEPVPVPPVVACIGPITAAAARSAGLAVTVEADDASPEGLVAGLAAHRAGHDVGAGTTAPPAGGTVPAS